LLQLQAQLTEKHNELASLEDDYRKRDEELEAEFETLNQQIAEYNKRAKELNTLKEQFFNEKQEWRAKMGAGPSPGSSGRASPSFFAQQGSAAAAATGGVAGTAPPSLRSASPLPSGMIVSGGSGTSDSNGITMTANGSPLSSSLPFGGHTNNNDVNGMPSLPIHPIHTLHSSSSSHGNRELTTQ
jgi:hypothetical protein